jgi:hypothetical protein
MIMTKKVRLNELIIKDNPSIIKSLNDELKALNLLKGRRWCLHCEEWFNVKDIMVQFRLYERPKGKIAERYLSCPNGDCDGSPFDWFTEKEEREYRKVNKIT